MSDALSTRRDPRFPLGPDSGEVNFETVDGRTAISARLTRVSVAGLEFRIPDDVAIDLAPGTTISPATIRVGHCAIVGEITVRNFRTVPDGHECGCLFIPGDEDGETRWMILLEGLEAAQSPPIERR